MFVTTWEKGGLMTSLSLKSLALNFRVEGILSPGTQTAKKEIFFTSLINLAEIPFNLSFRHINLPFLFDRHDLPAANKAVKFPAPDLDCFHEFTSRNVGTLNLGKRSAGGCNFIQSLQDLLLSFFEDLYIFFFNQNECVFILDIVADYCIQN